MEIQPTDLTKPHSGLMPYYDEMLHVPVGGVPVVLLHFLDLLTCVVERPSVRRFVLPRKLRNLGDMLLVDCFCK